MSVSLTNGLKEDYLAEWMFDGDKQTQAVFKAATMHVTVSTPT